MLSRPIPALAGARIPHAVLPPVPVPCELLVHFDQAIPAQWRDYSVNDRVPTVVNRSGSAVSAAAGHFDGGAQLVQTNPGSVAEAAYNTQAEVDFSGGSTVFGVSEFFMSAWVKLAALPAGAGVPGFAVMSTLQGVDGNNQGVVLWIDSTGHVRFTYNSELAYGAGGAVVVPADSAWHLVAASRKKRVFPQLDLLSTFVDGVLATQVSTTSNGLQGANWVLGAYDRSTTPPVVQHVMGFQGSMDEAFAIIGPGTGIQASFTPPTRPYNATNVLPPVA
jgi:hypothetical protein